MNHITQRLFFALEIDPDAKQKIFDLVAALQHKQDNHVVNAHWIPKDNFHVTMRFMGEVGPEEQTAYVAAVRERVQDIMPFYIHTTGLIGLPAQHPHLAALAVEKTQALETLFDRIDQALTSLGARQEKHVFTPHITLVKAKHHPHLLEQLLQQQDHINVIQQKITHLTLFRTDHVATSAHTVYTPIIRINL